MRPVRVGIAVVTLIVVATAMIAASAGGASATKARIELVSQPSWVRGGDSVTAVVRVEDAPSGATLQVKLHRPPPNRSAFLLTNRRRSLSRSIHDFEPRTIEHSKSTIAVRFQVSGNSTSDDAASGIEPVELSNPGVYPLSFDLVDANGTILASLVSYVIRLADAPTGGQPTQVPLSVATQLRLTPTVNMGPNGVLEVPRTALAATRSMADALSATTPETRAGIGLTVSPSLLDALAETNHSALESELASATKGTAIQRTTWSPVDLERWLATPALPTELSRLTRQATAVLTASLHAPDPRVADITSWGSQTGATGIEWLHQRSTQAVVVPESSLESLDETRFSRTLAAPFELDLGTGESVPAVQIDSDLSAHFSNADPALGANQLVADLAVIALDLPSMRRAVVVAPPRNWTPNAIFVRDYLAALDRAAPSGSVPLVTAKSTFDAIEETPMAKANGDSTTAGPNLQRRLRDATPAPPLTRSATAYRAGLDHVSSLAGMEPGGAQRSQTTIAALQDELDLAMAPTVSSAQRTDTFQTVTARIDSIASSVELPERQTITLTSDSATLPITLRRAVNGPRVVTIHVDAPSRLVLPDGDTKIVRLDETTTHLTMRVHSNAPGDAIVELTVTSPDNALTVGTTEIVVRSTAASGVGLLISFGSLAFLALWWGRDIIRTRRARRAAHVPPADLIDID